MERFSWPRIGLSMVSMVLVATLPAAAQKVRDPTLRGNPYRNIGGSCVYGGNGELLYAPRGAVCPDRQRRDPEASMAPAPAGSSEMAPALRAEMSALLEAHSHVAAELEKLRRAIAEGRKDDALEATSHVVRELSEQRAREARLFEALSAS